MTNRYCRVECRAIGEQRAAAAGRQTGARPAVLSAGLKDTPGWIVTCNFNV